MSQTSEIFESIKVTRDHLELQFKVTPQVSSINNNAFSLVSSEATSVEHEFETVLTSEHYNSISRILILFFKEPSSMDAGEYILGVSGLKKASGLTLGDESFFINYNFESQEPKDPPSFAQPADFLILDKSIKSNAFLTTETISKANPFFYVVDTSPQNQTIFVDENHDKGQVTITFNQRPGIAYINRNFFKVQRKEISLLPKRWELVSDAKITLDGNQPKVYIHFPSNDATPVYGLDGLVYFEQGYKYRVIISKNITPK